MKNQWDERIIKLDRKISQDKERLKSEKPGHFAQYLKRRIMGNMDLRGIITSNGLNNWVK